MQNPVVAWLQDALAEYTDHSAPVTYGLIGLVVGVFAVEMVYAYTRGLGSTRVFATGLFGLVPWLAWPLAPLLHSGSLHFLASVGGLWLLGLPVEQHWRRWRYAAFLFASGYLATAIGVLFIAPFTEKAIAFYGSSGMIYALAGFALAYLPFQRGRVTASEWLAVFVGAIALLSVASDPFTGPYFAPDWINGGHLGGLVVGLGAGSVME